MGRKILLVDDNKDLCASFRLWFPDYDIITANTAEEALAVLARPNSLGLVLLDVEMPGMGGLAALERIHELAPGTSVIIMTGYGSKDVAVKALRGRAAGYLEKPFSIEDMRAAIEKELSADLPPADGDIAARVERVKRYIEDNCFRKLSLKDAAAEVYLTPKYLSRVFRERTGMGFTDYKLKVKIEQAKTVLRSGDTNIKRLAARLGYANSESFLRQFNKISGCLPSAYRKAGKCPIPRRGKRS